MYQQNQNANTYRNRSSKNIQNVPSENQQTYRQFHNYDLTYRSNGNRIPRNEYPPAHLNVIHMETNSNVFPGSTVNEMTAPRSDPLNTSMASLGASLASTSHDRGRTFPRFENVRKPNVAPQFTSPAALVTPNQSVVSGNRSVTRGSTVERAETESVVLSIDTNRNATKNTTKRSEYENIRIFTGSAEKIMKWHKIYHGHFCYYELIASFVSMKEGTVRLQKILLLRDKNGPVIQVIRYINDHIKVENLYAGQMLRCVGRMVGSNILHGLSIREATLDEVTALRRMCYISEHAITKALAKA